jgi:hypothetical protein
LDALGDLDMARFTRQFPPVLDTLMKNILDILYVYEQERVDDGDEAADPEPDNAGEAGDGGMGEPDDEGDPQDEGGGGEGGGESDPSEGAEGSSSSPGGGAGEQGGGEGGKTAIDDLDIGMDEGEEDAAGQAARQAARDAARAQNKDIVEKLMEDFRDQWEPAVDKLEKASKAFEGLDLSDLTEGPEGFDVSKGLWQQTGWQELDSLRKKLEELRELRDLVRSLGRGAGRGPLRRAPRQRERQGMPIGLVRLQL